jgi:hypothetical protein
VQGPSWPQGPTGPPGPSGSSHAYSTFSSLVKVAGGAVFPTPVTSLSVQAGSYVIWAKGTGPADHDLAWSIDTSNGTVASALPAPDRYSMMGAVASLPNNTTISVDCTTNSLPYVASLDNYLVAMKVDAVN